MCWWTRSVWISGLLESQHSWQIRPQTIQLRPRVTGLPGLRRRPCTLAEQMGCRALHLGDDSSPEPTEGSHQAWGLQVNERKAESAQKGGQSLAWGQREPRRTGLQRTPRQPRLGRGG